MSDLPAAAMPVYEVVSPEGVPVGDQAAAPGVKSEKRKPTAGVPDLNGKKIGLVWSAFKNGNVFLESMETLLGARFKGIEFVKLPGGSGLRWGDHPNEGVAQLARDAGVDAAIAAAAG
jgi:hypothetical protein